MRIVISGPESSGKSTLAASLAGRFRLPVAMEYARIHLATHPPPQSAQDLLDIARLHREWQLRHVTPTAPAGIYDTGILNYLIWADVAFGQIPTEIQSWLHQESTHIHLLCEPDLPWQPDPLREYPRLQDRLAIFERHLQELQHRNTLFHLIRGQGPARQQLAETILSNLLQHRQ